MGKNCKTLDFLGGCNFRKDKNLGFVVLAAKHSAILFLPALLALVIADTLFSDRSPAGLKTKGLRRIGGFPAACLMGVVLLWSLYGFRYPAIPNENVATTSVADYMASARPEVVTSFSARIVEKVERAHVLPQSIEMTASERAQRHFTPHKPTLR